MYPAASNNQPNTYRCSKCDINWACIPAYRTCPECGQAAWMTNMPDALSVQESNDRARTLREAREAEAKRKTAYAAKLERFEKYYADREARRLRAEMDAGIV